jgi:hypothetical protein
MPDRASLQADPGLYPELAAAGSLARALQQEARLAGSTVAFRSRPGREELVCASVHTAHGRLDVSIGAVERWFIVSIWLRGVQMTSGKTKALGDVVTAARALASGVSLLDLHATASFLRVSDLALAHERGPAEAVTTQWCQLRTRWAEDERFTLTADIVEAAYANPVLRQLFPYTSHASLCFSVCTGFPYSNGIPRIDLGECGYVVRTHLFGDVLGEAGTPQQAVDLVLAHLPRDIGPAVAGTAADHTVNS